MKYCIPVCLALLSVSCISDNADKAKINENQGNQPTTKNIDLADISKEKVTEAITLAKKNKDFRFLATSGRSISIPGVDMNNFETLIELCGKNYSTTAGDVITTETQRLARKQEVDFMRQYNLQMLVICQNEFAK